MTRKTMVSVPRELADGSFYKLLQDKDRAHKFLVDSDFAVLPLYRHPPRRLEMADVVKAHMDIPQCPVLTSNQCHALATKLNACLDEFASLNPEIPK